MTERKPPGMSFETWIDHQITQAQERGAFDGLAAAGRPLPDLDREETSYDWALKWARRQNEDVTGMLPPALALRRERDRMPDVVPTLPSEAAVRAMAEDYDDRVRAFWRRPQEGPAVVPGLADADALVRLWHATRPAPAAPGPEEAGPEEAGPEEAAPEEAAPEEAAPDGQPPARARRWFRRR